MKNVYHLHAILVHRGGIGSGHYYAFIRPNLEDKWFDFNDSAVTPVMKSTAISTGSGGYETVFVFLVCCFVVFWFLFVFFVFLCLLCCVCLFLG